MAAFLHPANIGGRAYLAPAAPPAIQPPGDTTAPVLTGQLAVSGITHNSATLTVPTASDNVGVVGYEWSIDGGATYPLTSTLPTKAVSGLPSAATIAAGARAYDAAGNRSDPLAATFNTAAAPVGPPATPPGAIPQYAGATIMRASVTRGTARLGPDSFNQTMGFP